MIVMGLQNLLGIKGPINLTPEGLMTVGLRTVRQTIMAILANDEAVEAIRDKKQELLDKAANLGKKAPAATAPAEAPAAPADEPAAPAPSWAVRMR